jgi:hypothetical protein
MPFQPVEVVNKHNRPPQASISYERRERQTKKGITKAKLPTLLIAIPTTLSGQSKKEFWMLQLGTGDDAGKARIVGVAKGGKHASKARDSLHAMTVDFGYVPMLGEDAAAKEYTAIRKISDDEFEIDLPIWFKSDVEATEDTSQKKVLDMRKSSR